MSEHLHAPRDERELKHLLHSLADQGQALGRGAAISRGALDALGAVAVQSMTVQVGAGVRLARVEQELEASGLTLGPLPPGALELELCAFVEGPLAGLRAIPGGRLEPITSRLRGMLADGTVVETSPGPRSATGPDLAALFLGAGGRLALLTEATVRAFPRPAELVERRADFPTARAFVDAVCSALAAGLWPARLGVAVREGTVHAEVHLWGSAAQVRRDVGTWELAVKTAGGLSTAAVPARGGSAAALVEAPWGAVERALLDGRTLELHRLALASVVVCGEVEGLPLDGPAAWQFPAAVLAALDPRQILGGAP